MRKFTMGLIVGIIISFSATAVAAVNEPVTDAIWSTYNVVVNGGESQEIDTITHHDSAYYPVRSLANLLGFDVTWKADTRTIVFTTSVTEDVYGPESGTDGNTAVETDGSQVEEDTTLIDERNLEIRRATEKGYEDAVTLQEKIDSRMPRLLELQTALEKYHAGFKDEERYKSTQIYKDVTAEISKIQADINIYQAQLDALQ